MGQKIKYGLYALLACFAFTSCGGESTVTEEVVIPTQGLITYVQEMEKDQFKISDEEVIADTAASLIIATYLDATKDTFTLAEARLMESNTSNTRGSGIARAASFGLMGYYFMGRSRFGGLSRGAYVDQRTYNKVSNGAGSSMKSTAGSRTVSRPSGKSGYGGGRSTRSVGG